jgi:ABC-type dipeptide/oligopeptide/nickel transport system permease subunit
MRTFFPWKRALRRKTVWLSLLVMVGFGLVTALAPWIAPHDPYRWDLSQSNLPPGWTQGSFQSGFPKYLLGTDYYGRDILTRLLYGTRTAFLLALTAVPLAALIGTLIGLVAGYVGGRLDGVIQLVTETIQSLPGIMFMVVIILIFRSLLTPSWVNGLLTLIVGFAAVSWAGLARLIRIEVLRLKSEPFVEAAVALGASPWLVIRQHLLPNVLHLVLIWIINNIPAVILLEAVLGYIGVGVTGSVDGSEFTVVSLGGLFFSGRAAMNRNPLMLLLPALCVLLISMSFILLADFLNSLSRPQGE